MKKLYMVARRVNKAEYDNTTSSCNLAYGCLVEGKALCDGFVNAANLLAWCIDLPSTPIVSMSANHTYMAYCINGVWVSHEATSHDESFKIIDPKSTVQHIGRFVSVWIFGRLLRSHRIHGPEQRCDFIKTCRTRKSHR